MSMLASIETLWMKAEIKQEAKELRKLRLEMEAVIKKANGARALAGDE